MVKKCHWDTLTQQDRSFKKCGGEAQFKIFIPSMMAAMSQLGV